MQTISYGENSGPREIFEDQQTTFLSKGYMKNKEFIFIISNGINECILVKFTPCIDILQPQEEQ